MKFKLISTILLLILLSSCTESVTKKSDTGQSFQNEKAELIALGSYPDYFYNLANELSNVGRTNLAIEAYQNCIKTSASQFLSALLRTILGSTQFVLCTFQHLSTQPPLLVTTSLLSALFKSCQHFCTQPFALQKFSTFL